MIVSGNISCAAQNQPIILLQPQTVTSLVEGDRDITGEASFLSEKVYDFQSPVTYNMAWNSLYLFQIRNWTKLSRTSTGQKVKVE